MVVPICAENKLRPVRVRIVGGDAGLQSLVDIIEDRV